MTAADSHKNLVFVTHKRFLFSLCSHFITCIVLIKAASRL